LRSRAAGFEGLWALDQARTLLVRVGQLEQAAADLGVGEKAVLPLRSSAMPFTDVVADVFVRIFEEGPGIDQVKVPEAPRIITRITECPATESWS
jgi:hypothetical protein